jgi:hypothetical protein
MMWSLKFRHSRHPGAKLRLALACLLAVSILLALALLRDSTGLPRVWAAREVPVAFWAWRTQAPEDAEVSRAARQINAQTLFLRAGQIHYEKRTLKRVRAVAGSLPTSLELQLVYNGTPALLAEFERLDASSLATVIAETYTQDLARAARDNARVRGLQLDIDAPTRLLKHYARILRETRARLPAGTLLSVTGLPTWMQSPAALNELLAAVDFWIPQLYGATIPQRLEEIVAISSPQAVARAVNRARSFDKPFYAGLSAYGQALLYNAQGALISLRGDINPSSVAEEANLQLVERRAFETTRQGVDETNQGIISEWRYVYRARGEGVVDGLVFHAGESLVLDMPNAFALRESARAVRALAGEKLLGLCIFRLPGGDDSSTLSLVEIAAALADATPVNAVEVQARRTGASRQGAGRISVQHSSNSLSLSVVNSGNTSALFGNDALTIDLLVPAGSVRAVNPEGFSAIENLCETVGAETTAGTNTLRPCTERRANVVRFRSRAWMAGARAQALILFTGTLPEHLTARVYMQTNDGRTWRQGQRITISGDER